MRGRPFFLPFLLPQTPPKAFARGKRKTVTGRPAPYTFAPARSRPYAPLPTKRKTGAPHGAPAKDKLLRELRVVQVVIESALFHQLRVRALLDDAARIHH